MIYDPTLDNLYQEIILGVEEKETKHLGSFNFIHFENIRHPQDQTRSCIASLINHGSQARRTTPRWTIPPRSLAKASAGCSTSAKRASSTRRFKRSCTTPSCGTTSSGTSTTRAGAKTKRTALAASSTAFSPPPTPRRRSCRSAPPPSSPPRGAPRGHWPDTRNRMPTSASSRSLTQPTPARAAPRS